jgi:hypothetical protein
VIVSPVSIFAVAGLIENEAALALVGNKKSASKNTKLATKKHFKLKGLKYILFNMSIVPLFS